MKTTHYNQQIALFATALLGIGAVAVDAHADGLAPDVNSKVVHYADLDLNNPAAAKVLYRRIRTAAEQVCGNVDNQPLERVMAAKACMNQAIIDSVRAVNSMRLTHTADAQGYAVRTHLNLASAR